MLLMRFNVIHATQSKDRKWIHPIDATPVPGATQWIHPIDATPVPGATQATEDARIAVALRTCDPETPIDWHRVAASHTPAKIWDLVESKGLNFRAFRHNRETNFGTTLGDIVRPCLVSANNRESGEQCSCCQAAWVMPRGS